MNQGARNKLRNMGGIMASSPKLMQAAFQAGGSVRPPGSPNSPSPLAVIPSLPSVQQPSFGPRTSGYAPGLLPTGTVDPRMTGPARRSPTSPAQGAANATLEDALLAQRMEGPLTFGGGAQPLPTAPDMPFERRDPRGLEAGLPRRMEERVMRNVLAGEGSMSADPDVTIDDLLEGSGAPFIVEPDTFSPSETDAEPRTPPQSAEEVGAPTRPAPPPDEEPPVQQPPALEGLTVSPELLERVARTVQDDTNLVPGSVDDTDTDPDTDPDTGGPRRSPRPAPAPSKKDLRSRYKEKLELFKEIYGEDDEDRARDKAMSLAMLGLAIAAGQSPDALTNIAQGTMAGLQGMSEQEQARREREQGIRQVALDLTLSEREAEDAFIRGQMEAEQEFIRDLALAEAEKGDPKLYSDTASILKAPFGEFEVFKTTRQGFEEGLQDKFKAPEDIVAAYNREMAEKNRIGGNLARAQRLLKENPDQIAGIGGAFARTVTSLANAFGIETPNLTPSQEYDTLMTQLATELAPVILGESGRTISDADRARVAEALGFVVDKNSIGGDPGISVTGFAQTAVSDPDKLSFALETISSRLDEAYEPAADFMKKYFPKQLEQAPAGEAIEIDGSTYIVREGS